MGSGEGDSDALLGTLQNNLGRCAEKSNEAKTAADLNVRVGRDFEEAADSLRKCLDCAKDAVEIKGARSNLKCESLLRECAGLGGDSGAKE